MNPPSPLANLAGATLRWRQPSLFKDQHELLTSGGEVVARLFGPPKLFSSVYRAEGFGGSWEFAYQNFWQTSLGIRDQGKELPFAVLSGGVFRSDKTLELPKGERWTMRHRMWKGIYEVTDAKGMPVVTVSGRFSFKWLAEVTLPLSTSSLEKYPWVLMLVYLFLVRQRHRAAHGGGG